MSDERKAKFEAQTREQFEALGRFVQAFEQMVFAIRTGIESRLQQESSNMVYFTRMLFHHRALTAQPLWEMLRAIIYTDVDELRPVTPKDIDRFSKLLSKLGREVTDLISIRNTVLHGTPFIGWVSSEQEDFSKMSILKWGVSGTGWSQAKTPETAADLLALVARCEATENAVRYASLASQMPLDRGRHEMVERAITTLLQPGA